VSPTNVHPIEVESYRIMRDRVDLSAWTDDGDRAVVERMIHATADESFATSARIGAHAVQRAVDALRAGAPIIADAAMVAAGIGGGRATCLLAEVPTAPPGTTRSAAAIDLAVERHPTGAVWVIGNAPTALFALLAAFDEGRVDPAAVVGVPVGYVGAAESKAALWASPLAGRAVTNEGRRGGSPVAAGAVNALLRIAERTSS
jgi:precorrin-8X/cobalt-precorrin-8 methylmutase